MKKTQLFFILILFQNIVYSQQNNIDSLLVLLKEDKVDTNKLNHLNKLSWEYMNISVYDSALLYANSALELSNVLMKEAKNSTIKKTTQKNKASSYKIIGNIYDEQSNYPEALKNHIASLKMYEVISNKEGMASAYNNIGNIYDIQGNYPEALKNHFASLKISEALGDKKGIARSYNNLGIIYKEQGNYSDALKNLVTSLKIKEAMGNKKGVAYSYNNIGNVYTDQAEHEQNFVIRNNILDLALKNYISSLRIFEELRDTVSMASSYNNIGIIYKEQGNYPEALKNYFSSLKIRAALDDKAGIISSYTNIGNVFTKQKKYKEAGEYLIKAKNLSIELRYKEYLKHTYSALTELDIARGNYKGAFENHKLYILYRDSLDNEETRKKTIESQMTYDFEKKEAVANVEHKKELENQETLAEEKSKKQKVIILLAIIGLVIVLVFSGFIFRSLRVTRKQKHIIEQQKQEVEQQKHLVEEHQKDIIDSITYAKRLQQAILPSREEIKKHLPDSFILYKPKDIVAGDFYWLHVSPNEEIVFIAAADSTGHGVPGAMVSVVCSNALNRAVNEFNLIATGKILDKARELVLETFAKSGEEIKDGMDISLLAINKATRQINWSGANNALWYIQENNLVEIKPDKQPIGKTDNPKPFTTHAIGLKTGDTFYLMTDGYADQFGGEKGKKYKYKQLQENLIANTNSSLAEQQEKLTLSFEKWKGNLEQVDDVTIIGIRI